MQELTEVSDAFREMAREAARQHQRRAEDATRSLLSRWVSELEPTIAYDQEYRVIGASYGGAIALRPI